MLALDLHATGLAREESVGLGFTGTREYPWDLGAVGQGSVELVIKQRYKLHGNKKIQTHR